MKDDCEQFSAATIVVAVNKLNKCGFEFVKMLG